MAATAVDDWLAVSTAALLANRMQTDPVWTAREIYGFHLWSKQREIVQSVWAHEMTAVRSGHGVGKTAVAALIGNEFLHAFPDSLVVTTAPSWTQVETLLWKEWHRVHRLANERLAGGLGTRMTITTCEKTREWRAFGISTDKQDRLVGQHAPHLLVIIDEAFGVADWVIEAIKTWGTGGHFRVLCIGNPTDPASAVAQAWKRERGLWNTLHVSAFDSPCVDIMPDDGQAPTLTEADLTALNLDVDTYGPYAHLFRMKLPQERESVPIVVSRSLTDTRWVMKQIVTYAGNVEHPLWMVRVLGEFGQTDGVISLAVVEAAQARSLVPSDTADVILGCDVATTGTDETVISSRCDKRIRLERIRHGQDTMATAGDCAQIAGAYRSLGRNVRIVVDSIGVGEGVADRLIELGFNVTKYKSSEKAIDADKYPNRRSETWYTCAEQLAEMDLDADDMLAADLAAPKGSMNSRGQLVVEPKDITKKRLGRSPDRGDSVLMTLVPPATPYAYAL